MTLTFNEIARERNRGEVQAEVFAYGEMLHEALTGALANGPDSGPAMLENLRQFNAAMDEVITRWSAGEVTLPKSTTVAKCKSMRDRIEKRLEEAGELPARPTTTKKGKAMPTTPKFANKGEVLEEANRLARELMKEDPNLTLAQARSKVWEQNPELARQHKELPKAPAAKSSVPLRKGQSVVDRATREAREIQKNNPGMSEAAARARVWEQNPDLAAEYARASRP